MKIQIEIKPIIFNPTFIDLGLPSGNLWSSENVPGYYTYEESLKFKGVPRFIDFAELIEYCTWVWDKEKNGQIAIGPNGNSIFFPANGFYNKENVEFENTKDAGYYWSLKPVHDESAHSFVVTHKYVTMGAGERYIHQFSVRLVINPRR